MKKIKMFLMLASASFMFSCESNTYQDISGVVTNPTYEKNIKTVINTKCTNCHSGGKQFPDLENYDLVLESTQNGNLLCKINGSCGGIMPQDGKMPQATIDMIQLWADQGFLK